MSGARNQNHTIHLLCAGLMPGGLCQGCRCMDGDMCRERRQKRFADGDDCDVKIARCNPKMTSRILKISKFSRGRTPEPPVYIFINIFVGGAFENRATLWRHICGGHKLMVHVQGNNRGDWKHTPHQKNPSLPLKPLQKCPHNVFEPPIKVPS